MVAPAHEEQLRCILLESGMCELVPVDKVPRDVRGRPIVGGLFAVPHKPDSDRLIFDRRPLNLLDKKLDWLKHMPLPHGAQLVQIVLRPSDTLIAAGYDLKSYFYQLQQLPERIRRNCFGRSFDGKGLDKFGGEKGVKYSWASRSSAWAT